MAITLLQKPDILNPGYNENIILVSSSNSSQSNFKYVFQIYDDIGNLIFTTKLPPRPGDSKCAFDTSRIMQAYLSYKLPGINEQLEFSPILTNWSSTYSVLTKYSVRIGEHYGTTPIDYLDLGRAEPLYIIHGGIDFPLYPTFNKNDYILRKGIINGPFLSGAPMTQSIELEQNDWQYILINPSGTSHPAKYAVFNRYSSSGTNLGSPITITNADVSTYGAFKVACGTSNIINTSGYSSWLNNVSYYTLQVFDDGSPQIATSKLLTFNITNNCRFTSVRLHFLNRLGGFDAFNFIQKSYETRTIEQSTYRKNYGSTSGTTWSYNSYDRGLTTFNSKETKVFKLNSDYLTDTQSDWLADLMSSSEIYQEINGQFIAVYLSNTKTYDVQKRINKKLFYLTTEMTYAYQTIRQRN